MSSSGLYRVELAVLAIAAIVVALSLIASIIFDNAQWFGRSGSILTLAGAIVEFRMVAIAQSGKDSARWTEWVVGIPIVGGLSQRGQRIAKTAVVYILVGTGIWGYGDLLPL